MQSWVAVCREMLYPQQTAHKDEHSNSNRVTTDYTKATCNASASKALHFWEDETE